MTLRSKLFGGILQRSRRFPGVRLRGGRRLVVRMDTTNLCNLRCIMCPMRLSDGDPDRRWHSMDPELFGKIASGVFPKASVVGLSCGAEPFMNPRFAGCLEELFMADVPAREVVTNGLLMSGGNAEALLDWPPTSLFVSVDGALPATHGEIRGGADLETVLRNTANLVRERDRRRSRFPRVSFSVTVQRRNVSELQEVVRLALRVGASSVNTVLLVPYEGLDMTGEVLQRGDPVLADALDRAAAAARESGLTFIAPSIGTATRGGNHPGCHYPESWVFIDPDGMVYPCPYWNVSLPLGNLTTQSFDEIWQGLPYEGLRKRLAGGILKGNCAVCPESAACGGEIVKVGSGKAVQPKES
jgi:radical SAM protein with 4Fe4S-binding SPASM domain